MGRNEAFFSVSGTHHQHSRDYNYHTLIMSHVFERSNMTAIKLMRGTAT